MLFILLDFRKFKNHVNNFISFKPISEHHGVDSAIYIKAEEYLTLCYAENYKSA